MATKLKPIGHEDRLSIVEHLTELRTRIVICVIAFTVVFGLCLWQEDRILNVINQPLADVANAKPCDETRDPLEQADCQQQAQKRVNERIAAMAAALAAAADEDPELRAEAEALEAAAAAAVASTPSASPKLPVTLGVGEPLTATLVAAGYTALLLVLPLLLYQAYAFILPAFSPTERQVAVPLMVMVPFLFYAGVVFAYFLVLPAAVDFLQNFNDDNYDVLLQARDYNKFAVMVMGVMGLLFQLPVVILAVTRMGIVTPQQLRKQRRMAILIIAILAALLPGGDPVTMILMMLPILVLYEGSILLASLLDRRAARAREPRRPRPAPTSALRLRRLMLFDLRGTGRRRTVKIVYVTLAILMGGGLVLFGIGGSGALSGGLLDAITESSGTGDGGTDRLIAQEQQAATKARQDPTAATWAAVARARFNLANSGDNVDQATGNYTDAGAEQLRAAGRAWEESLKLAGDNPDPRVASLMVSAYAAIGELDKATTAQEIIAEDRNSAGAYATLAQVAYEAGQTRKGDLAADKALELTDPDMREALKGQLDQAKQASVQQALQDATQNATPAPSPSATPETE